MLFAAVLGAGGTNGGAAMDEIAAGGAIVDEAGDILSTDATPTPLRWTSPTCREGVDLGTGGRLILFELGQPCRGQISP